MEIMIALFIVAILTIVTIPIIRQQLAKADEFSYYLAYNTVEKMAGQIVALGDEEEIASNPSRIHLAEATPVKKKFKVAKLKRFFANLGNKFAKSEEYMFRSLFSKALAAYEYEDVSNEVLNWDYSVYDDMWLAYHVCNGEQIPKSVSGTSTDEETGESVNSYAYYNPVYDPVTNPNPDFNECIGYTKSGKSRLPDTATAEEIANNPTIEANAYLKEAFLSIDACDASYAQTFANNIKSASSPDAKSFCENSIVTACGKKKTINNIEHTYTIKYVSSEDVSEDGDDGDDGDDGIFSDYVEPNESPVAGSCSITDSYRVAFDNSGSAVAPVARPDFSDADCKPAKGYYNMRNAEAPEGIFCVPKTGYYESSDNVKVACRQCSYNEETAYALPHPTEANPCICCKTDYNSNTGTCCPDKSVFNGSTCECVEGYEMKNGKCKPNGQCSNGSTWNETDQVCVVNPPIVKAKRLCEKIVDNWNISSSYCNAFQPYNGMNVYRGVYNAAMGDGVNRLMSIRSKVGAFGLDANGKDKIKPNIVFANGLKLWILGDKAASIPGLTYTTDNASMTQNICKKLDTHVHISCKNAGGWFCKSENNCFTLDDDSKAAIGDARSCCSVTDLSDISAQAQTDPNYDPDDYLKNTQAYAIAGFTVFVDINGNKGNGTLWVDVFPFFIAANGSVYPGYPLDGPKAANAGSNALYIGGNSADQLTVDVYYYTSNNDSREKVVPFPNVSYARGVCSARLVSKYAPYCMNLGQKYFNNSNNTTLQGDSYLQDDDPDTSTNPCDKHKCYVSVKRKLKTL